ncbi:biofilm peroxide resistance protein BsmA [Trabulsiella odontotermitis]|uniref:Biofilm stress and motility protein A n=1 Tax=Trabulsiella odontotermitis TaxID=379893 RepID=A0A0L0GWL6_9ENTR|nr:biofilm peroxide resistance protein BsmA [Trabulsiella odontotermitis]KNC90934.1 biofilm stress and motility protein A [Trabulsiella odontotermitis]KNC93159.1 biofilm stress and motility protein A [Trabulsiella odontotermitis]
MAMRRFAPLMLAVLLSGCTLLEGTPEPPPPLSDHPQEIRRNQTEGLQRMGTVSALVHGSPMDVEAAIKAKVVAAKADYYVIVMIDDTQFPGQWYSQAILYRK